MEVQMHDTKVNTAPRITTPYKEYSAVVGDDLQISCIAQSKPVPSYSWLKEDIDVSTIISLSSQRPLHSFRSLLYLPNIKLRDEGIYICVANNSLGEDRRRFKVTVVGECVEQRYAKSLASKSSFKKQKEMNFFGFQSMKEIKI
ncbi:hypothetical protein B4U79_17892 [Dinothrombium tinctorium]|uniref:Ig-like domain-containing protein n=1 Tax=Dinothrombium tinctorium TaxID=1965070 RepID=A0A3S3QYL9_9ACAR|nr:hypothetical protein B4U79_17901 [Dinothrombium tinctorium]RWS15712.1 hypothetical protein B4U79_17900 [Dinothrombium tinctorium]RWS15957.1 hypothetical protein B4U79_17892 [Dinothrombium tinctorium]